VFVEEWEDDGAPQRHFATPHIASFMAAVPAAVVAPPGRVPDRLDARPVGRRG
jgi:quinol monooxygenase YgiN